jgi:hypothetical protein
VVVPLCRLFGTLGPSGFACEHSAWGTGDSSAIQIVLLKTLPHRLRRRCSRRADYLTSLANLRLFVEDPSLQGRSAQECVHS